MTNEHNPVSHPAHYTSDPSNVECIEIARHLPFALGNAVKYLWRADKKGKELEDLQKALWYLNDYREQHNGIDTWLSDPALADIPWPRIAQWALWQASSNVKTQALMNIFMGDYVYAVGRISELIDDLAHKTPNLDGGK